MTTKYKPYPAYKNSGVEWLGEAPAHWEVKQFRHVLKAGQAGLKIGPFGSMLKLEDTTNEGIRVYGQENVISGDFTRGKRFITEQKFQELSIYETFAGDILITMMGTSGRCMVVPQNAEKGIIDSHLVRLSTRNDIVSPYFIERLVDESAYIKGQIDFLGKGSIMHGLNSSIIKSLFIAIPSLSEQEMINTFIKIETAKIDTLIAKQEHLIELLQEKRTALISHAVTKGLNPDAPMKDSGVEWLGEAPEHWEVKPIKYVSTCNNEVLSESTESDYEIEYVDISSVDEVHGITSTQKMTFSNAPSRARRVVRDGDIIVSTVRTYLRAITSIHNPSDNLIVSTGFAVIRPSIMLNVHFAHYLFKASYLVNEVIAGSVGVSYPAINSSELIAIKIGLPSLDEQSAIAAFLDRETAKIDTLIQKSRQAIDLLKERRTALISAAVTGKIDVRDRI